MRMHRLLASSLALGSFTILSSAQAAPKTDAPPASAKSETDEPPPRELAIVAAPVLPVGDAANGVGVGLGGTVDFAWQLGSHVSFVARAGYVHHLPKSGIEATLGAVPLWAGARYLFSGREGAYLEGTTGPTLLFASVDTGGFGRASTSDTRVGLALGGGYRFSHVDVGARFVTYDLGHLDDAMGLMATLGIPFLAF
jgi:hypothetical protein